MHLFGAPHKREAAPKQRIAISPHANARRDC
jgi:hypothetical protein